MDGSVTTFLVHRAPPKGVILGGAKDLRTFLGVCNTEMVRDVSLRST
jgi:hypothetical protein